MKSIFSFILCLILTSCSKNDEQTITDKSFLQIEFNGKSYIVNRATGKNPYGINKNCNSIFGTIIHGENNNPLFVLDFDLTIEGGIKTVLFVNESDNSKHYYQADFNPKKTFKIANFKNVNGTISFDFEGTLFRAGTNQSIFIKGKILDENTKDTVCTIVEPEINLIIDNEKLSFAYHVKFNTAGKMEYLFLSNNGYMLSIFSDKKLESLEIANFNFTQNSDIRVELKKFIGSTRATTPPFFIDSEWESYNCFGNLNILKQNTNPKPHTEGSFNITAKNDAGMIVHQISNATFKI